MKEEIIDIRIKEKAKKILEFADGNLCPRCMARNFFHDIPSSDNLERGEIIFKNLDLELTNESDGNCFVCNDIFQSIDNGLVEQISNKLEDLNIEFTNFLVGCRVSKDITRRELEIHELICSDQENIKKEINREIGKALSLRMNKEVEFENPNLVILVDYSKNIEIPILEIQINPLFIEGRYKKIIRGIPQTKWPCRACKGRGCEQCNYTGKMYQESVEELISPLVLKESGGSESKFHGAGREDIDVKMLGEGRPFVLEIKEPLQRNLDLIKLETKINQYAAGKVEVKSLKMVDKSRRQEIKTSSTNTYKVYHATVDLDKEITLEDLEPLKSIKIIEQRTPRRVVHRRADIIRKREIRDIKTKLLKNNVLDRIIECQGGLYIKELISGDEERTHPSISSLLKTPAKCVQLDVLDVKLD
ncbi:MAG: tRNA pseudouridine(54/55) synthase Pus10 [Methanobacterium sp.]|nr:tRNA pseudouridine(54/55) synthase Pus10 [Methanobacterium sp.]